MKKQKSKAKTGVARMLELAGQKKHRLLAACALSVVAAAARIVPFFTIYALVRELLQCYAASTQVAPGRLSEYAGWTLRRRWCMVYVHFFLRRWHTQRPMTSFMPCGCS